MMSYQHRLILHYLANLVERLQHCDAEASRVLQWIYDPTNHDFVSHFVDWPSHWMPADWLKTQETWGMFQYTMRQYSTKAARRARRDQTAQRLRRLGKMLGLPLMDVNILELLLRCQTLPLLEAMIEAVFRFSIPRPSTSPQRTTSRAARVVGHVHLYAPGTL